MMVRAKIDEYHTRYADRMIRPIIRRTIDKLSLTLHFIEDLLRVHDDDLSQDEHELICFRGAVTEQIWILEKMSTKKLDLQMISKELDELRIKQSAISALENCVLNGDFLITSQQENLRTKGEVVSEIRTCQVFLEQLYSCLPINPVMRVLNACKALKVCSVDPEPEKRTRFLLVSNAKEIYCLKLYQNCFITHCEDVPLFPGKLALLEDAKHPEETLSDALFEYRFNACVNGFVRCYPLPLQVSLDYYSLVDKKCNLSNSETSFRGLRAENMHGLVHIFGVVCLPGSRNLELFHEVRLIRSLVGDDDYKIFRQEIPTIGRVDSEIISHLMVGCSIYAVVGKCIDAEKTYLEFDGTGFGFSNLEKEKCRWTRVERKRHHPNQYPEDIWDIMYLGYGICLGEYTSPAGPLYVVMALQGHTEKGEMGTFMVAYLLTSEGKIVCYQRFYGFFRGPVLPCKMRCGTIIEVGNEKNTLCSVHVGSVWDNQPYLDNYLFISFFSVEEMVEARSAVQKIVKDGNWPMDIDFMHVTVEGKYVYQRFGSEWPWYNDESHVQTSVPSLTSFLKVEITDWLKQYSCAQ